MVRFFSIRPVYCLFVFALLMMSGCQQTTNALREIYGREPTQERRAEDLLDKDEVAMRQEAQPLSPIEQHMKARGDVDPKKVNRKNRFSKTVDDYEKDGDDNFRLVRVEPEVANDVGLAIDTDPVQKQERAKTYVERILDNYKAKQQARLNGEEAVVTEIEPTLAMKQDGLVVSQSSVEGIRIGQHPGKTRIVMDVTNKTSYQTRIESSGRRLVVTLPNAVWATNAQMTVSDDSIIRQFRAEEKGRGSVLYVDLNAAGRLAYKSDLKPSGGRGHRIVLDIVSR